MARAFLLVLDSFGIGHASDAAQFGDEGANTFRHIEAACAEGRADRPGLRQGPLGVPNMRSLGLDGAAALGAGQEAQVEAAGFFGAAEERSSGKDTTSGHWEIAGLPVTLQWGYFPRTIPSFPEALTSTLIRKAGLPGILGNCHAAGTEIIARLGEEHIRTGKPICYTSADSVFQIAAHEEYFGLDRLYALCQVARGLVDEYRIGRVIARPFVGENAETFVRTANRRDYAVPPPEPTLLDRVEASGGRVFALGKVDDIFAHRGIAKVRKAADDMALFDTCLATMEDARDGDLVFVNFNDFDTLFGHRRDVAGYAAALEAFDARLPEALKKLQAGDLLILTADHGCDPTWKGTNHTRERIPILGIGGGLTGSIGLRRTFSDIGESIAAHLGLPSGPYGCSFLPLNAYDA